ncbi:phospholipid phosphatase 1-like [Paramacrobiotus metropolitanus]|uniref:phospholipid phosphatase 1-like n=1 Tax=Paramacrobiotus metropolitanus TaxID=2943436 RepID=UPI002445CF4C|nr:phospholipid phosphatase 1-like [Paramacrobiotus metropolitanus]
MENTDTKFARDLLISRTSGDALIPPSEQLFLNIPDFSLPQAHPGPVTLLTTADGFPLPVDPVEVIVTPVTPGKLDGDRLPLQPIDKVKVAETSLTTMPPEEFSEQLRVRDVFSLKTVLESVALLIAILPVFFAPCLLHFRGFYCDCPTFRPFEMMKKCTCHNPDISYPYTESSVDLWLLYLLCLLIPAVTILLGEYCHFYVSRNNYGAMEIKYRLLKDRPAIPPMGVSLIRIALLFVFGFFVTKSLTDVAKYSMGFLRPHFLEVCQPDFGRIYMDGGCDRYVTEPHCWADSEVDSLRVQQKYRDSRLGFISAHASLSFYCMLFMVFYAESRFRWMRLRFLKAIAQFTLLTLAIIISISRITDNMHHWPAVLMGGLLGAGVCYMTVFMIGDFFNDRYFVRRKLADVLQKIDWDSDGTGGILSQLFSNRGHRLLRKLRHTTKKSANRHVL